MTDHQTPWTSKPDTIVGHAIYEGTRLVADGIAKADADRIIAAVNEKADAEYAKMRFEGAADRVEELAGRPCPTCEQYGGPDNVRAMVEELKRCGCNRRDRDAILAKIAPEPEPGRYVPVQPCGHPATAVVSDREGTSYCGACRVEQE